MNDKVVDLETRNKDWMRIRGFLWSVVALAAVSGIFFAASLLRFTLLEDAQTILSTLTPLILYALFVERTSEVFITVWRGKESDELTLRVQQEEENASVAKGSDKSKLHELQRGLTKYKGESRDVAFVFSLILGILISLAGVRAMALFVDPTSLEDLNSYQTGWFTVVDILVTGAMIGGGADGMHKITALLTTILESSRSRAAKRK